MFLFVLSVFVYLAVPLAAQQPPAMPPAPAGFTEARQHSIRGQVRLPGTVESETISTVAGQVPGLVVEFPIRVGDRVEKGQVLAKLRTETFEIRRRAAQAELKEAEARRKLAERNLNRAQELFDSKVFSQKELDDSLYEFNAWQGRIDKLQSDIAAIDDDIERCVIVAPFDGVVLSKGTEIGEWMKDGNPVVDLMSVDELQVSVNVPEQYYSQFRPGSRVSMTFEALGGKAVLGTVRTVVPNADPQARTFPVKLSFENSGGKIAAGMLAEITFSGGDAYGATIVPKDAIVNQGGRRFVYVIDENNAANSVPVETGAGVADWIEVRGPVRPGQRVVTRGNERLRPGQTVQGSPVEYKLP